VAFLQQKFPENCICDEASVETSRKNGWFRLLLLLVSSLIAWEGLAQQTMAQDVNVLANAGSQTGRSDLGGDHSAGRVASVFEQQPEWLEWIASKGSKTKSKSSNGSWSSWWSGASKPKTRGPVSSYRRDNKTYSQRMWASTKRAWATTASWLDPFPDPKPESPMRPAKKSWYSSWTEGWGGKSDKPSQSVSEFIGQEHPK
jgi:hypothetical protein